MHCHGASVCRTGLIFVVWAQLAHTQQAKEYDVIIEKLNTAATIDWFIRRSLTVASVSSSDGLVQAWNGNNPDSRIEVGDNLIEVNGVRNSRTMMLYKAETTRLLLLKFLRNQACPERIDVSGIPSPPLPNLYNGVYSDAGISQFGRPVYKDGLGTFLYYREKSVPGWSIGSAYNEDDSGSLVSFSTDPTWCPNNATVWTYLFDGKQSPGSSIKLKGQAWACGPNCRSCRSSIECTACSRSTYLQKGHQVGKCVDVCPEGFFSSGIGVIGRVCVACHPLCRTCISADKCTACTSMAFRVGDKCVAQPPYTRLGLAWTHCSRHCGGGFESRQVRCYDKSKAIFYDDEAPCSNLDRLPNLRSCNVTPCETEPVAGMEAILNIDGVDLDLVVSEKTRPDFERQLRNVTAVAAQMAITRVRILSITGSAGIRVLFQIDDAGVGDASFRFNKFRRQFIDLTSPLHKTKFAKACLHRAWLQDVREVAGPAKPPVSVTSLLSRFTWWQLVVIGSGTVVVALSFLLFCWHCCCKPPKRLAKVKMLTPNSVVSKEDRAAQMAKARSNGGGLRNPYKEYKVYPEPSDPVPPSSAPAKLGVVSIAKVRQDNMQIVRLPLEKCRDVSD